MIYDSFFDLSSKYFLEVGSLKIAWYAICILVGIILAYILGIREGKKLGIPKQYIIDGLLICVPLAIIGARLYYVIFDPNKATNYHNLIDVIAVWRGGNAIMGSVIVAVIFVVIYCKKRRFSIMSTFDLLAPGLLIGQVMGRWGNWFNGEAHGPIMSEGLANFYNKIMPWVMNRMSVAYCGTEGGKYTEGYYHPTFLYESLWNLIGLIIILITRRKSKKIQVGDYIAFYLAWYGFGRAVLIEPLRQDQLLIGGIPVNIILPAVMCVAGIVWLVLKRTVKKLRAPYYHDVLEAVKEKKVDTVVMKLEGVVANVTSLVKNAYYYTMDSCENKQLEAKELNELMKKDYHEVLDTEEKQQFFNEYFKNNLDQIDLLQSAKPLFAKLHKNYYKVLIYSKYSQEIIDCTLEKAKISKFVNTFVPDCTKQKMNDIVHTFNDTKNGLLVSNVQKELTQVKDDNFKTCYTTSIKDQEIDDKIDYAVSRFEQIENILVI